MYLLRNATTLANATVVVNGTNYTDLGGGGGVVTLPDTRRSHGNASLALVVEGRLRPVPAPFTTAPRSARVAPSSGACTTAS